ncbi:TIR domain-containing protein [Loktanella salsilacus]|uniref:TIR domain-containing protein n=1 Tax=Loktanella salsilacus TaxID=195913 RepID=UPI0020B6E20A|nr:TIR domain-containing protein [Loktanella salsilacus]UTH49558.1 TIR domain-containing protein [Loktanella salsilacus]
MPTYNIFVSHAWSYSERYHGVIKLLNTAKGKFSDFDYVDYSVPAHDPLIDPNEEVGKRKLTELLKAQIAKASSIIVPAGMYVNHRYWIQKEIDLAKNGFQSPKRIISIQHRSQQRSPQSLIELSDVEAKWGSTSLAKAVAGLSD